jgi:hypothetical protein
MFGLFRGGARQILLHMAQQQTVVLTGTHEMRVAQLLEEARRQAGLAQSRARPRVHETLIDLEAILDDQIAALANAAVDDEADATVAAFWDDDDKLVA